MLIGLAKSGGITWNNLPNAVQSNLEQQFLLICQSSNENSIANAFWAMGSLGARFDLNSQEALFKDIMMESAVYASNCCAAWGLCNVLWGLAKMKFQWKDLPKSLTDSVVINIARLEGSMNAFDIATLLWSVAELDFSLDSAPKFFVESLLQDIEKTLVNMKAIELSRTIWGLSGSGLSWNMLPEGIKW